MPSSLAASSAPRWQALKYGMPTSLGMKPIFGLPDFAVLQPVMNDTAKRIRSRCFVTKNPSPSPSPKRGGESTSDREFWLLPTILLNRTPLPASGRGRGRGFRPPQLQSIRVAQCGFVPDGDSDDQRPGDRLTPLRGDALQAGEQRR